MKVVSKAGMTPSEIRDYIGHEHIQLRILFVEVEHACCDSMDVRPSVLKLVDALENHLRMEDRLLVPALRECDGWGQVRAERVAEEHGRQREQLGALRHLAKHGPPRAAVHPARELIAALLADMEAEEKDLLDPDLLRDDVVVVDQTGG